MTPRGHNLVCNTSRSIGSGVQLQVLTKTPAGWNMNRIPPGLAYLTIFNSTLHPTTLSSPDDEDAEEQAHILFYTSKERAVSRDRMLRQVGLAKALINFSEWAFCDMDCLWVLTFSHRMFSPTEACSNIHSQSRRMIMLSPEPDFWIHGVSGTRKSNHFRVHWCIRPLN